MVSLLKIPAIGDPEAGRPTLGRWVDVEMFRVVRLLSMEAALKLIVGKKQSQEAIFTSGQLAGDVLYKALLSETKTLEELVSSVTDLLQKLKVGLFSVTEAKPDEGFFRIRVDECTSCAGMENIGEPVCFFEGGLISGILRGFTGKEFTVIEVKCWGKGDRTCEFEAKIKE